MCALIKGGVEHERGKTYEQVGMTAERGRGRAGVGGCGDRRSLERPRRDDDGAGDSSVCLSRLGPTGSASPCYNCAQLG